MVNNGIDAGDYAKFRSFLEQSSGIVLGENKYYLVQSRLNRLLKEHRLDSIGELIKKLQSPSERRLRAEVVDAMTTNETSWFRDRFPFALLQEELFPEYSRNGQERLRLWSAACSSGQEAYSIAMTFKEFQQKNPGTRLRTLDILGTDISTTILDYARRGVYDAISMARGLSAERQKRFFDHHGDKWTVKPEIRQMAQFREHNLQQENVALLGRFDIVFLRNVLIYFSADAKRDILRRAASMLNPGGVLFLGASESMSNYSDAFTMVKCRQGVIYRRKEVARPTYVAAR